MTKSVEEKEPNPAGQFIQTIFKNGTLPPVFSETFAKGSISWKHLKDMDFEKVGRILTCHLLIEIYVNKLIEITLLQSSKVDDINLTFIQKLKLVKSQHAFQRIDFYGGITIINKIRNKYSHNIEAKIDQAEIGVIRELVNTFHQDILNTDLATKITKETHSDVAVIEEFTSLFCAFIGGYCTASIER